MVKGKLKRSCKTCKWNYECNCITKLLNFNSVCLGWQKAITIGKLK